MRSEPVWQVELLADHPELIPAVGELRWREWGRWGDPPESEDRSWWIDVTRSESGRTELPVTFVGLGPDGALAGAVGIGKVDPPELQDRGPWVIGVIVDPAPRRRGAAGQYSRILSAGPLTRATTRSGSRPATMPLAFTRVAAGSSRRPTAGCATTR